MGRLKTAGAITFGNYLDALKVSKGVNQKHLDP